MSAGSGTRRLHPSPFGGFVVRDVKLAFEPFQILANGLGKLFPDGNGTIAPFFGPFDRILHEGFQLDPFFAGRIPGPEQLGTVFRNESDDAARHRQMDSDREEQGLGRDTAISPTRPQHREQMSRSEHHAQAECQQEHRLDDGNNQLEEVPEPRRQIDRRKHQLPPSLSSRLASCTLRIFTSLQMLRIVITFWYGPSASPRMTTAWSA